MISRDLSFVVAGVDEMVSDDFEARVTWFEHSMMDATEKMSHAVSDQAGSYLRDCTRVVVGEVNSWAARIMQEPVARDVGFVREVGDSMEKAVSHFQGYLDAQINIPESLSTDAIDRVLSESVDILNNPIVARLPGTKIPYEPRLPGTKILYEPLPKDVPNSELSGDVH